MENRYIIIFIFLLLLPAVAFGAFVDNGDGTITDYTNNLMWRRGYTHPINYTDAVSEAASDTTGGWSDWRLPTQTELETILDNNYFPRCDPLFNLTNTPGQWDFWSSTRDPDNDAYIRFLQDRYMLIFFGNGPAFSAFKNNNYSARYVRSLLDAILLEDNAYILLETDNRITLE
ncbi:MAG: Lcl C-terminal domain-containing protein [Candidatus Thorarchaeota archaeon]